MPSVWVRRVVAVGVVLLVAAGCRSGSDPAVPEQPAVVHQEIHVDGARRTYRLFTPPSVGTDDRPLPLVLALHGSGNTPESFVQATRLDRAASAGGFVVAYPEAVGLLWNGGFCCTAGRGDPAADVRFLERVITDVAAARRVDTTRVYAVGVSAGGIMAYRLACDLAGRIAGVASVGASMQLDDCQPSRPVSVLAVHGTGDQLVPYAGGRVIGAATRPAPPAPAVVERWAALNGCAAGSQEQSEGLVTTRTWPDCQGATRVRLVTVEGGGHTWFTPDFGVPNGAVDATGVVVEFFGLEP